MTAGTTVMYDTVPQLLVHNWNYCKGCKYDCGINFPHWVFCMNMDVHQTC